MSEVGGLLQPPYGEVLFSEREVHEGIRWMAACVVREYADEPHPLFVALLRGAMPFASALMTEIARADPGFHPELETITIKTYGTGREASEPEMVMGIDEATTRVAGRRVVVLDDMIDQGLTAAFAAKYFEGLNAGSVDIAALTIKQRERHPKFNEFAGGVLACFEVPDVWITGMGMDDANVTHEGNRWLPLIAVAKQP